MQQWSGGLGVSAAQGAGPKVDGSVGYTGQGGWNAGVSGSYGADGNWQVNAGVKFPLRPPPPEVLRNGRIFASPTLRERLRLQALSEEEATDAELQQWYGGASVNAPQGGSPTFNGNAGYQGNGWSANGAVTYNPAQGGAPGYSAGIQWGRFQAEDDVEFQAARVASARGVPFGNTGGLLRHAAVLDELSLREKLQAAIRPSSQAVDICIQRCWTALRGVVNAARDCCIAECRTSLNPMDPFFGRGCWSISAATA